VKLRFGFGAGVSCLRQKIDQAIQITMLFLQTITAMKNQCKAASAASGTLSSTFNSAKRIGFN